MLSFLSRLCLVLALSFFSNIPAHAGCVSPAGQSSHPVFKTNAGLQFCPDGDNWQTVVTATAPGGSNGQVQFNSANAFAGDADLSWDNANKRLGIGTPSPQSRLEVAGEARVERLRARDCAQLVKTIPARDYPTLQSVMLTDETGQAVCGAGWHVCNAQEVGIYGIVYGCEAGAASAWIVGGFPNTALHNRSLWNGQDDVQCQPGNYPQWYPTYRSYKGRVHCAVESTVAPVACCRVP